MFYFKIVIILILLICLSRKKRDGFLSEYEKSQRADELHKVKEYFTPGVKYTTIKEKLPWIDSVVFDDAYNLALKNKMGISNLEKIIS